MYSKKIQGFDLTYLQNWKARIKRGRYRLKWKNLVLTCTFQKAFCSPQGEQNFEKSE